MERRSRSSWQPLKTPTFGFVDERRRLLEGCESFRVLLVLFQDSFYSPTGFFTQNICINIIMRYFPTFYVWFFTE